MGKHKINLETILDKNGDLFSIPDDTNWDSHMTKSTKKKVNGKRKGNTYERDVAKDLSKRFKDTFRRVPQSGAYMGGVNQIVNEGLREDAKEILAGDIIAPKWFPFVIECKNYADTPKLHNLYSRGDKDLDEWLVQAYKESKVTKKPWIIQFKITSIRGKEFICLDFNLFNKKVNELPESYMIYKGSIILDKNIFYKDFFKFYCDKEESDITDDNIDSVNIENIIETDL